MIVGLMVDAAIEAPLEAPPEAPLGVSRQALRQTAIVLSETVGRMRKVVVNDDEGYNQRLFLAARCPSPS